MRLLLDTHAVIWALAGGANLPADVRQAVGDSDAHIVVSAVTAFEVATKVAIGKLPSARELALNFEREIGGLDCILLPITVPHAVRAGGLPLLHRDPFDRLLIAQAQIERLTLVSNEPLFDRYGVDRLW